MRIISGCARGMRLTPPPGTGRRIRPTSDRCREALFSIITDQVHKSRVLDLFAGTGAMGIEALSRGAAAAVFVDLNPTSLTLVSHNLERFAKYAGKLQEQPSFTIIKTDLRRGLASVMSSCSAGDRFDIVFVDPPYGKGLAATTLTALDRSPILAENALVIVEERSRTALPESFETLAPTDSRRYGDTGFWLYRRRIGV